MLHRTGKMKFSLWLQVVALMLFCFCRIALAAPPETDNIPAGELGYLSAHTYVSPTNEENVYKIRQELTGSNKLLPTYTDLVILVNTGHAQFTRTTKVSGAEITGSHAFGYVLSATTGLPTSTPRNRGTIGDYSIWNAMCYSAEKMIDYIFDPTFNPNYQNCRIAFVSYGNSTSNEYNSPTLIGLTGYEDALALKAKLGGLEASGFSTANNPVPLGKGVQAAYRLLENKGTQLYFNPAGSAPSYYSTDFNIPYADGFTDSSIPANMGAWEPKDASAPSGSKFERFIVSLHSIGASSPNNDAAKYIYGTYPLSTSVSPITPLTTNPNAQLSYTDSVVGYIKEGVNNQSNFQTYAYNWARFNILEVSEQLKKYNNGKVPYQTFALWIDPNYLGVGYASAGRWMDFNYSVSAFPMSQSADSTHPFAGTGYEDYQKRLAEKASGKTNQALDWYVRRGSNSLYEAYEGMQYWNDEALLRNIYTFQSLQQNLEDFVSSITVVKNQGLMSYSTLNYEFELYKFPGQPLLNASYGTATNSGTSITWNVGVMPDDPIWLEFYVHFTGPTDASTFYPVFDESYITYEYLSGTQSTAQCKYYPNVYVNPKTSQTQEGQNKGDIDTPGATATSKTVNEGLLPIQGIAMNGGVPYTPSVTPAANQIVNESLQESNESIPVTSSHFPWFVLFIAPAVAAIVFLVKRHKESL